MRPLVILAVLLTACSELRTPEAAHPPTDWRFTPGASFGPLLTTSSEQDLVSTFGAGAVEPTQVDLGEGNFAPGTLVFRNDPLQTFSVTWQDTIARRTPESVRLAGDTSRWTTTTGIGLGTSLSELERLNGSPVGITGFGWDYGGTITDWRGGKLAPLTGRMVVSVAPADTATDVSSVLGDSVFTSSDTAFTRIQPRVTRIIVWFE
jgi:hypothetical protein